MVYKRFTEVREKITKCEKAEDYRKKWSAYEVSNKGPQAPLQCKAWATFDKILLELLNSNPHVKSCDAKMFKMMEVSMLNAMASKEEEVTLSGEGGEIVRTKSYWEEILQRMLEDKNRSLSIFSIGGGIGYDAWAIVELFKEEGFNVKPPIIIDPNSIAGFLSEEVAQGRTYQYYVQNIQDYFEENHTRQLDALHLFHIGTTLNIVSEHIAVEILKVTAKNMGPKDILSILLVDEAQLKKVEEKGIIRKAQDINPQGLTRFFYQKTKKHYKTVIGDKALFKAFMCEIGLEGYFTKYKAGHVKFIAYKSVK